MLETSLLHIFNIIVFSLHVLPMSFVFPIVGVLGNSSHASEVVKFILQFTCTVMPPATSSAGRIHLCSMQMLKLGSTGACKHSCRFADYLL
jgi:hypothetical protein